MSVPPPLRVVRSPVGHLAVTVEHGSRGERDTAVIAIHVCGDLDLTTAPALTVAIRALPEIISQSVDIDMDMDLSRVPFCDLDGLEALLTTKSMIQHRRGHLTMHHHCHSLRILLDKLNLTLDVT
jgi:ABC-type transporter Mla MlaB component